MHAILVKYENCWKAHMNQYDMVMHCILNGLLLNTKTKCVLHRNTLDVTNDVHFLTLYLKFGNRYRFLPNMITDISDKGNNHKQKRQIACTIAFYILGLSMTFNFCRIRPLLCNFPSAKNKKRKYVFLQNIMSHKGHRRLVTHAER